MTGRRDRGTTVITAEERARRAHEAKDHIRKTATYTPALKGRVESRIDANAFRRCISDNTIYQSICNSLKDKNLPERERRPDLVDFLALEAITPVNYDGEYNRVIKDLYVRCHTEAWVTKAVLEANHEWFRDQIAAAKSFIQTLINTVDSQLLEIILEDFEGNFWREDLKDNVLYKKAYNKILEDRPLTERDVLTVIALNGGKYPTEIFRHLVIKQNSSMLNYGSNIHAQNALYEDGEVQGNLPKRGAHVTDSIANLEDVASAMQNRQLSREVQRKLREVKELMKGDSGVLHAVQSGRIQKTATPVGHRPRPATPGNAHSDAVVYMGQNDGGHGGYDGYNDGGQRDMGNGGQDMDGVLGNSGTTIVKTEEVSPRGNGFLPRSGTAGRHSS